MASKEFRDAVVDATRGAVANTEMIYAAHKVDCNARITEARWNDYLFVADALMDKRMNADDVLKEWKSKIYPPTKLKEGE